MNNTITLKIKGMACHSCAQRIQQALIADQDVKAADVNLAKKKAVITTASEDKARFIKIIQAIGYDAA
jgi:copper chaperone CopZ